MINYDDLETAFMFVSSDFPGMCTAVIHKKTGKSYYYSELSDTDDYPDDASSDDYIEIPHKNDLGLGRELVFDFIAEYRPDVLPQIREIFSYRGAYSRFRSFLNSAGLEQKWYDFENKRTREALQEWCKMNNLEIED